MHAGLKISSASLGLLGAGILGILAVFTLAFFIGSPSICLSFETAAVLLSITAVSVLGLLGVVYLSRRTLLGAVLLLCAGGFSIGIGSALFFAQGSLSTLPVILAVLSVACSIPLLLAGSLGLISRYLSLKHVAGRLTSESNSGAEQPPR